MPFYHYCPMCGAQLSARRIPDPDGPERRVCSACGFIQWGNSKPTAAGILVDEQGQVLLARRAVNPYLGWWDVPGGFLEAGEHPEAGVLRELREETGIEATVERLVGVYMDTYSDHGSAVSGDPADGGEYTLNFYYLCRAASGAAESARAEDDVDALAWFAPDALPENIAFPDSAQVALRDWRRHVHATAMD